MNIIDTHCHLQSDIFKISLEEIISSARNSGITTIINASTSFDDIESAIEISNRFPMVKTALGIHPWFAKEEDIEKLKNMDFTAFKDIIAIGEIGMDKKMTRTPLGLQEEVFETQLKISRDTKLPVIIHCLSAYNEIISSLKKFSIVENSGVLHGFTGNKLIARNFIDLGICPGIGGFITKKISQKHIEMIKYIYPDNMVLETDSPFMPIRGETINHPENIRVILNTLSEILGKPTEEIAEKTTERAKKIFNI